MPSAAAVTWTLSLGQAESLLPGASVRLMLVLVALLDGHGIPGALFTTQVACDYAAGDGAGGSVDPARALSALLILERAGLLSIDQAGTLATVRMVRVVQSAVRAAMPPVMFDRAARAAADALVAITGKLRRFRGESRFTTWAYKFVIFEVSAKIGRHFWRHPSVPLDAEDWDRLPGHFGFDPAYQAEWRELFAALRRAVD